MAKTRFIQSSFVSGELSPLLKGRIDINQYYQAVETADNVVIVPQGGMRRRPGTSFVGQGSGRTHINLSRMDRHNAQWWHCFQLK
jgi:hypothetical protein